MASTGELARLIVEIAGDADCARALDRISSAALSLTHSRVALIAMLDADKGVLELRHGAGVDWDKSLYRVPLPLDVGREEGIVSFVAATGSSVVTGNVRNEPHYRKLFDDTESEIAVPVRDRDRRVRAVLNLECERRDAYGESEREVVVALAGLIEMMLEKQDHALREEALIEIGGSLETALTEEALIARVIQVAEEVLRFQACSVFLIDPKTGQFVLRGTIGSLKSKVNKVSYERGQGFTGWVADKGEPILLENPQGDPRWQGKYVEIPADEIASFLAVPILSRGRSIGAIRALRRQPDNRFLDNRFTQDDLRLFQAIAEQVAIGLENLRNLERIVRSERMIAWGELSAKSSHMIGNRVFALKGDINELQHVLEGRDLDRAELVSLQKSLFVNVTRIEEILQDFRDFVTATQLVRSPEDINVIVRETVDEVFPKLTRVKLVLELAPELPPLNVDQKKLRRAVSELIENSLNYIEEGSLSVSTRLIDSQRYERTKRSRFGEFVEISVEDTGPGVEQQKKAVIFQPFFSGRVKGMGLGLSIVKGIVDAHGGEVFEAGEEGEGAKFVILLPVA